MVLPVVAVSGAAIKSVLSGWKFYAILAGIAVVALAAWSTYKLIYNSGYQKGAADTVAVYQPKIDKANAEAIVRNAKIEELEKTLKQQAFNLITLTQKVQDLSLTSIEMFTKEFPEISKECSVKPQTASAYNNFLTKALLSK